METRKACIASIDDLLRDIVGNYLRPETPPGRELNITMGQLHCLIVIARLGNPTMSEVANELKLHPSTVTVLMDGLVAHGLANRKADPQDRRVVRVSQTAKGRKNHERHRAQMHKRVTDMLSELSDEDLRTVRDSLAILQKAGKQYFAKAAPRQKSD